MLKSVVVTKIAIASFLLATIWGVTVTGYFENASLDVEHLDAGAGNNFLLVRALLALVCTLLSIPCIFKSPVLKERLGFTCVTLLSIPLFLWSCLEIERWASNYSENAFRGVVEQHFAKVVLSEADVFSTVGSPYLRIITAGLTVICHRVASDGTNA